MNFTSRVLLGIAVFSSPLTALAAQNRAEPAVIPKPAVLRQLQGEFEITAATTIWSDSASMTIARQLARVMQPATGFSLAVRASPIGHGYDGIVFVRDTTMSELGPEGYALDVRTNRVTIRAPAAAGQFYAIQTVRQLLPPAIFRKAPAAGQRWVIPAVSIEDSPRFAWRGAHLDVARHFMPKEFVEKYIDLLALHKMNTFHWHLTDDQGWRIEIRKYPRLTNVGGWRPRTIVGHPRGAGRDQFDDVRHGGYYTQDDIREVVAYAAQRFVTIVPEIEMPGHAQAAIAAYPYLGVTGDSVGVWTSWGVSDTILAPTARTVSFMQDVLSEVLELFPGPFIHVGGDEASKTLWKSTPAVHARMRELGLADEHELQSWFIRQMDAFLTARGRRLVGWDEILEGGLAPNATVMSWRGTKGAVEAARAGHDVIMAPGSHTYFDHYQSQDRSREPLAIGGYLPLDTVYLFEPVPPELDSLQAGHVLGAQAQLWTEYITTPKQAEYMAYPRLAALAEVLWSARDRRDLQDFHARLSHHLLRLDALDVNYRPIAPRAPGR
jgi:hexosaminidase